MGLLADDKFEITYDAEADGTVELTVKGTFVQYDNKFKKLTVTSSTGEDGPDEGDVAYGLEIPGFAFFLKPMGGDGEPIVMVKAGACPSENFDANWVIAKYQDGEETPKADQDAMGSAVFAVEDDVATIVQRRFDNGNVIDPDGNDITLTSCSNGAQGFDDGGGGGTMYLTANGGALVNPGSGIIFAAPQLSADVTKAQLEGVYSGLVFRGTGADGDKIFPAKVTLDNDAVGTGVKINNVETDETEMTGAAMDLEPVASAKGLVHGTVDTGEGTNPINCVFSSVAGNELLACNGADDAADVGGVYPSFFFLGVKR